MKKIRFIIPGSLEQLTGGYIYDKNMVYGLRKMGYHVTVQELRGDFPIVDDVARSNQIGDTADLLIIDGLALPAFEDKMPTHFIALIHHPLFKETGLNPAAQQQLFQCEKKCLHKAQCIFVTSEFTKKELIKEYQIPTAKIFVVCPGNKKAPIIHKNTTTEIQLLCVASVVARKGHDILLQSLAKLQKIPWHLNCVGALDRDANTVAKVKKIAQQYQLQSKVTFTGELSQEKMSQQYERADVFVLASFYEGYGMAITEAICHGLPIISTTGGAIPYVVGDAAILVEPGNIQQTTEALHRVITDTQLRNSLKQKSLSKKNNLPSWKNSYEKFASFIESIAIT